MGESYLIIFIKQKDTLKIGRIHQLSFLYTLEVIYTQEWLHYFIQSHQCEI